MNIIHKGYTFRLDFKKDQMSLLHSNVGAVRFAYNWTVNYFKTLLDNKADPKSSIESKWSISLGDDITSANLYSKYFINKLWNQIKQQATYKDDLQESWWQENSSRSYRSGISRAYTAYKRFRKLKTASFPVYKSRHKSRQLSITFDKNNDEDIRIFNTNYGYSNRHIKIPYFGVTKIYGSNRSVARKIRKGLVRILSFTVTYRDDNTAYLSLGVEESNKIRYKNTKKSVGIDLGIIENKRDNTKRVAILSDRDIVINRKLFKIKRDQDRIRIYSHRLSRKIGPYNTKTRKRQDPSNNYTKAKCQLSRRYRETRDRRDSFIQEFTSKLVKRYSVIKIEDLHISEMIKNNRISKSVMENALGKIKTLLTYKMKWYRDKSIDLVDRFYPSSKRCSNCGTLNSTLKLFNRIFKCGNCLFTKCRDINAAINILNYLPHSTESQEGRV